MKSRSALIVAAPVTLALTLWGATAMSVPTAPAAPAQPSQPAQPGPTAQPGGGSAGQVATIDQRRISALEEQNKAQQTELTALRNDINALKNDVNALKARMQTAENNIRPLQSHTHSYEVENLGGMNLATIQAHAGSVLIATKPSSQQGATVTKTSSGPKN